MKLDALCECTRYGAESAQLIDQGIQQTAIHDNEPKTVYWHRDLPPLEAELVAEHTVEADSGRVAGTLADRDDLSDRCYAQLMTSTASRLTQEVARLGGDYAHVHDEAIGPKHDDAAGEAWLHGCFTYVLYRRPPAPP